MRHAAGLGFARGLLVLAVGACGIIQLTVEESSAAGGQGGASSHTGHGMVVAGAPQGVTMGGATFATGGAGSGGFPPGKVSIASVATSPTSNQGTCLNRCWDAHGVVLQVHPQPIEVHVSFDMVRQEGWGAPATLVSSQIFGHAVGGQGFARWRATGRLLRLLGR